MAKKDKAKGNKTRNDARQNGKANKKRPGQRVHRTNSLSELEKVLLGGGYYTRYKRRADEKKPAAQPKRRRDSDD